MAIIPPPPALPPAHEGDRQRAYTITWTDDDGVAIPSAGQTLSGKIKSMQTGLTRAIDGTLAFPSDGVVTWARGALDVGEVGFFRVQIISTNGAGLPTKSYVTDWEVKDSLDV